jgi:hypothetical protein
MLLPFVTAESIFTIHIPIKMDVFGCVCVSQHNSGTPGTISTKLGKHITICMYKNRMYILYIYIKYK